MYFVLFSGITCTNTSLQLSHNVTVGNDKQTYEFQEKVTMSCNYGFSGNNVTTQCTDVDKWSENSPNCTGKILYVGNISTYRADRRLSS
jgi:hypothetical protein